MSQNTNRTALLGKKLGMSQVWDENGFFVPVTLVDVSTNVVTAVKNEETDGYKAVQLGYGQVDPRKVTKPMQGHFAKAGVTPRRHLAEVRTENVEDFQPGQELTAELFPEGAQVDVTGTTKGKRMAGRMGHATNTVLNLTVVSSDVENGVIAIKGAIPGPKGGIVLVRSAVKGA